MANGGVAANLLENTEDWAIVVGIDVYPGLVNLDLKGCSSDAGEFYGWLVSPAPAGGGVPKSQAKLIRSSDFGPFASIKDARPAIKELEDALLAFDDLAQQNKAALRGMRVGRRLYLYFSGHGCAPDIGAFDESALLSADATRDRANYHVAGKAWAQVFRVRGYFDEIILLMDCCRELYPTVQTRRPPINMTMNDAQAVDNGRFFYGFATKWSRSSREFMIDGAIRGVFTYALLQGLTGKAVAPSGAITAESLAIWMSERMEDYIPPQQRNAPGVQKRPEMPVEPGVHRQIVLARGKPAEKTVPIAIPAAWVGGPVQLKDGSADFSLLQSVAVAPPVWELQLLPGLYMLVQMGTTNEKYFKVER